MRIAKTAKFTKTVKFTIICKTCDKIHEIYCKGFQGRPRESYENCKNSEIYENCEIYDNMY